MALENVEGLKGLNTAEGQQNEDTRINNKTKYQQLMEELELSDPNHILGVSGFDYDDYIRAASTDPETGMHTTPMFQTMQIDQSVNLWDSKYDDPKTMQIEDIYDLQTYRWANQPWYDVIANHLAKGLVNVASGFMSSAGFMYGQGAVVGDMYKTIKKALENEKISMPEAFRSYVDNPVLKWADDFTNWSLQKFINYTPSRLNDAAWYERLVGSGFANFIGQLLETAGTVVGFAGAGKVLVKAIGGGAKTIKGVFNGVKGAKAGASFGDALKKIFSIDGGLNFMKSIKPTRVSMMASSFAEASMEGSRLYYENKIKFADKYKDKIDTINAQLDQLDRQYEQGIIDELTWNAQRTVLEKEQQEVNNAIDVEALSSGVLDFAINIPILLISNATTYWNLGKSGLFSGMNKYVTGEAKEGSKFALGAKGFAKRFISEGIYEEMMQGVGQESATSYADWVLKNYFNGIKDIDLGTRVSKYFSELGSTFMNTYFNLDSSQWEEGLYGGIMGAIGLPSFRAMKYKGEDGKQHWRMPVFFQGGFMEDINQDNQLRREAANIRELLNKGILNDEWVKNMNSMIRSNKFIELYNQAINTGDAFVAKNSEAAFLIDLIIAAKRSGNVDVLRNMLSIDLNKLENDDAYLEELVDEFDITDKDGRTINNFKDENGHVKREEARKQIKQNYKQFTDILDSLDLAYEEASTATNGAYGMIAPKDHASLGNIIEDLVYKHLMAKQLTTRAIDMMADIDGIINNLNKEEYKGTLNTKLYKHLVILRDHYNKLKESNPDKLKDSDDWRNFLDAMFINPTNKMPAITAPFVEDWGDSLETVKLFSKAFEEVVNDILTDIYNLNENSKLKIENLSTIEKIRLLEGSMIITEDGLKVLQFSDGTWYTKSRFNDEDALKTMFNSDLIEKFYYELSDEQKKLISALKGTHQLIHKILDMEKALRYGYEMRTFCNRLRNNPDELVKYYDLLGKLLAFNRMDFLYDAKIKKMFEDNMSPYEMFRALPVNAYQSVLQYIVLNCPERLNEFEQALQLNRVKSEIIERYLYFTNKGHDLPVGEKLFRSEDEDEAVSREINELTYNPNTLWRKGRHKHFSQKSKTYNSIVQQQQIKSKLGPRMSELIEEFINTVNNATSIKVITEAYDNLKAQINLDESLQNQFSPYEKRFAQDIFHSVILDFKAEDKHNLWGIFKDSYDIAMKFKEASEKKAKEEKESENNVKPKPTSNVDDGDDKDEEVDEGDADGAEGGSDENGNANDEDIRRVYNKAITHSRNLKENKEDAFIVFDCIRWFSENADPSDLTEEQVNTLQTLKGRLDRLGYLRYKYPKVNPEDDDEHYDIEEQLDKSLDIDAQDVSIDRECIIDKDGNVIRKGTVIVKKGSLSDININAQEEADRAKKVDEAMQNVQNAVKNIEDSDADFDQYDIEDESELSKKSSNDNAANLVEALNKALSAVEALSQVALEQLKSNKRLEEMNEQLLGRLNDIINSIDSEKEPTGENKEKTEKKRKFVKESLEQTSWNIVNINAARGFIFSNPVEKKGKDGVVKQSVEYVPSQQEKEDWLDNSSSSFSGHSMYKPYFEHATDRGPGLRSDNPETGNVLKRNPTITDSDPDNPSATYNYELYYKFNVLNLIENGFLSDIINKYKELHDGEQPPLHMFYRQYLNKDGHKFFYRYMAIEVTDDIADIAKQSFGKNQERYIEQGDKKFLVIGSFSYDPKSQTAKIAGDSYLRYIDDLFNQQYRRLINDNDFHEVKNHKLTIGRISNGSLIFEEVDANNNVVQGKGRKDYISLTQLFSEAGYKPSDLIVGTTDDFASSIGDRVFFGYMTKQGCTSASVGIGSRVKVGRSMMPVNPGDVVMFVKNADGFYRTIPIMRNTISAEAIMNNENDVSRNIRNAISALLLPYQKQHVYKAALSTLNNYLRLPASLDRYTIGIDFLNHRIFINDNINPNVEPKQVFFDLKNGITNDDISDVLDLLEAIGVKFNVNAATLNDKQWLNDIITMNGFSTKNKTLHSKGATVYYQYDDEIETEQSELQNNGNEEVIPSTDENTGGNEERTLNDELIDYINNNRQSLQSCKVNRKTYYKFEYKGTIYVCRYIVSKKEFKIIEPDSKEYNNVIEFIEQQADLNNGDGSLFGDNPDNGHDDGSGNTGDVNNGSTGNQLSEDLLGVILNFKKASSNIKARGGRWSKLQKAKLSNGESLLDKLNDTIDNSIENGSIQQNIYDTIKKYFYFDEYDASKSEEEIDKEIEDMIEELKTINC